MANLWINHLQMKTEITVFPQIIARGDYFFFRTKRGLIFEGRGLFEGGWKLGLTVVVLISGAFVRSRLITNGVYIGVIHLHIAVPTITCFRLTLRVIHKLKRTSKGQFQHERYIGIRLKLVNTRLKL